MALDLGDGSAQAIQLAAIAETYNMMQRPLQAIADLMSHCLAWKRSARIAPVSGARSMVWAFHKRPMGPQRRPCPTFNAPWSWPAASKIKALTWRPCRNLRPITRAGRVCQVARYSEEIVQLARAMGDRGLVAEKLATSGYAYEQTGEFSAGRGTVSSRVRHLSRCQRCPRRMACPRRSGAPGGETRRHEPRRSHAIRMPSRSPNGRGYEQGR